MGASQRGRSVAAVLVLAAVMLCAACDQVVGTDEGKSWNITQTAGREGPRMTLKTETTGTDSKGKTFPVEIQLAGEGGSAWGGGGMHQSVELKFVAVGGPAMPEGAIILVPDGSRRSPFGGGEPGSEIRQINGGSVTCPTVTSYGPASMIRTLVGSKFVDVTIGPVRFQISDEQVRAMAELLRRLDATVPK